MSRKNGGDGARARLDLAGARFGMLLVESIGTRSKAGLIRWVCVCDCGSRVETQSGNLRTGHTTSCGCKSRRHQPGSSHHPLINTWISMMARCRNPKCKAYPNYGGRGITVCSDWESFERFIADMGERPPGTSLDRIDNDRGYELGNVRWATAKEQRRNQRNVKFEAHEPEQIRWLCREGYTRREIADFFGVRKKVIAEITTNKSWRLIEKLA